MEPDVRKALTAITSEDRHQQNDCGWLGSSWSETVYLLDVWVN
jgi:hypothetical protein